MASTSYAVAVRRKGHVSMRIGPFLAMRNAWLYSQALKHVLSLFPERKGEGLITFDLFPITNIDVQKGNLVSPRPAAEEVQSFILKHWRKADGTCASLPSMHVPQHVPGSPFPNVIEREFAVTEALPTVAHDPHTQSWLRYLDKLHPAHGEDTKPDVQLRIMGQPSGSLSRSTDIHHLTETDALAKQARTRREVLAAEGEKLQLERQRVNDGLKRVVVDLWRDGLYNVQEIGRLTGFARNTVYDALREAGFDAAARRAKVANLVVALRLPDGDTVTDPDHGDFEALPMFTTRLTASQASLLPLPTSYVGEPIIAYYKPGVKVSESILGRALGFTLRSTDGDEIAAAVTERVFDTLLKPSVLERALAERLNEMKSNPAEAEDYARVQAFAEHLKMSSPHLVIEGSSKHD